MKIRLFGNSHIERQDGESIALHADKTSALLIYLAANADVPIQRTELAAMLWGGYPDRDARRNLTNTLSRLKKMLPSSTPLFSTTRHTVVFTAGNLFIDSQRFDQLWGCCATVGRSEWAEDPQIIAWLTELVGLYQGAFTDGLRLPDSVEFEMWAAQQLDKYQQQTLTALETLTSHHLARHAYDSAEKHAQHQLTLEPWREIAHRQLIQLYVATGRHSAAAAQFDRCKRALWDELGVEPDPQTAAMLQTPSADPKPAPIRPRGGARRKFRESLRTGTNTDQPVRRRRRREKSAAANAFFGRSTELAQLQKLLADPETWLVTLHGEGGMGKTRLARAAETLFSAEFEDGVHFVQLVSVTDPAAIASAIIETIGLELQGNTEPFEQLCDHLADQQTLLILDNLEHLLAADEDEVIDQLLDLLDAAPDAVILVTSRQRLWVQTERVVRLRGLPHPEPPGDNTWQQHEAVQLFIARVQQADPSFDPAQAREPIIQICQLVEGLPLGIELAAAQSSTWSVKLVADELTRGMVLSTRMRDIPKRQRSLKTVFNYSWGLLDKDVRPILARCAIMRGDFSYDAFRAVTGGERADLQTLIAHAFVRDLGDGRYDIHELVRQSAEGELNSAEKSAAIEAHYTYFLGLVADTNETFFAKYDVILPAIRKEWPHIIQAWKWAVQACSIAHLHPLALPLRNYWLIGGHLNMAKAMLQTTVNMLTSYGAQHPLLRATLLRFYGAQVAVLYRTGDIKLRNQVAELATETYTVEEDPDAYVGIQLSYGMSLLSNKGSDATLQVLSNAYDLGASFDQKFWQLSLAYTITTINIHHTKLPQAEIWTQRTKKLIEQTSTQYFDVILLRQRALLYYAKWEMSDALTLYLQYDAQRKAIGQKQHTGSIAIQQARTLYALGMYPELIDFLHLANNPETAKKRGLFAWTAYTLLSSIYRRQNTIDKAVRHSELAIRFTNPKVGAKAYVEAHRARGMALCMAGRLDDAKAILTEAIQEIATGPYNPPLPMLEVTLAHVYACANKHTLAFQTADPHAAVLLQADQYGLDIELAWLVYQILARADDPRASPLLDHAHGVILWRANQISNDAHRTHFLNDIAEHKQILTVTEQG